MTDEITKPGEILTLRKWDAVLFTTYAISISFFESFVLHHLRRKGFGEIWVIVDADGYQNSLMERRAWGAGRDYHLIPVRLPKGVFHCKCTYLWSEEGDVLLIGSGNATFGGFGKNLESMQVLTPNVAPSGFSGFADFLESLNRRSDFLNPDGQWVKKFSRRARDASRAAGTPTNPSLQLTHSVERPIIEHVCAFLESHTPIRRVTVLSPYHDPDGRAVKSLIDRVSCSEIAIGLPGNPRTPSAFPFHLAKSWKKRVSAVHPDAPNLQRHLHSKWFEFACDSGVVALVGSVNATSQALCTTNNIEVGVLRFDANEKTLAAWKKAEVPDSFQPTEFFRSGQGQTLSVHAALRSDGFLAGRILTNSDCSGTWETQVEYSSDDRVRFKVSVGKEGTFRELFPGNSEETLSSTLQLVLRSGEREARGWVHVEEVLGLPERDRRVLCAIGRFVRGNADEDDDIVLLEYLAASAIRHLNAFDFPLRVDFAPDSKDSRQDEEMTIDLSDLKPDPNAGQSAEATRAAEAASAYVLDKWFAQLRKRLLGRLGAAQVGFTPVHYLRRSSALGSEEDDEDEREQKVQRIGSALESFDRRMRTLVETPEADNRVLRIILVMWLEVKLNMLASRLEDPVEANLFAREWFEKATTYSELGPDVSALEEHVFAIAAVLPFLRDGNGSVEPVYVALHEDLERFCRGRVPVERALLSASASSAWVSRTLLQGSDADLASSLMRILGTRTLRQEVDTVFSCLNSNLPIPEDSILFDTPEGNALRHMLKTGLDGHNVAIVEHADDGCPACQYSQPALVKQSLRNSRVATCSHCNHILLRTGI